MDFEKVKTLIKATLFTRGVNGRWGLPLCFVGPIGVGKTSVIGNIAAECGLGYTSMVGSILEPGDVAGLMLPHRDPKVDAVQNIPAAWIHTANTNQRHVHLFDELTGCPPAVQSAFLRVILEGQAADCAIDPRVRFLAAMNPADIASNGHDLTPALANRFGHLAWPVPNAQDWASWLLSEAGRETATVQNAEAEEKRVMEVWPEAIAKASGLVAAFIKSKPGALHKMPDAADPAHSGAWPSHRTWEMATRALAGAHVHSLTGELRSAMVGAFVGQGAAGELDAYSVLADLPDPEALLTGQVKWKHDPRRMDRTYATLDMATAYVLGGVERAKKGKPEKAHHQRHVSAMWSLIADVGEHHQDLIVGPLRAMCKAQLTHQYLDPSSPGFTPTMNTLMSFEKIINITQVSRVAGKKG